MGQCEMCGSETSLVLANIEGVELKVCKNCSAFGKIVRRPIKTASIKKIIQKPQKETIEIVNEDYSKLIREKREKMGLKQKELAKFLNERESIIHKMESNEYTPSIELARKLEKQLNIKLIEQKEIEPQNLKAKTQEYTIGDIIKIKGS